MRKKSSFWTFLYDMIAIAPMTVMLIGCMSLFIVNVGFFYFILPILWWIALMFLKDEL